MGEVVALRVPQATEMPASVEGSLALQTTPDLALVTGQETYGRSLKNVRAYGNTALSATVSLQENESAHKALYEEFISGVAEMLQADEELGDELETSRLDEYEIRDGRVMAYDDKTFLTDLCWEGARRSKQKAEETDGSYMWQYIRDRCDAFNAEAVDKLRPGQFRLVGSYFPETAMRRAEATGLKEDMEALNYEWGLSYLQLYYKDKNGKLLAGTFSIHDSEKAAWRATFASFGVDIPADESEDTWLRHALKGETTKEQALQLIDQFRKVYAQNSGTNKRRHSINEIMATNQTVVNDFFEGGYKAVSMALATGHVNETVRVLARETLEQEARVRKSLIQAPEKELSPEDRHQLMRAANGNIFDDAAARSLEMIVRIGVVEEIRNHIFDKSAKRVSASQISAPIEYHPGYQQDVVMRIAMNGGTGLGEGRSYKFCGVKGGSTNSARNGEAGSSANDSQDDPFSPQAAYGDRGRKESSDEEATIPEEIRCIKCDVKSPKRSVVKEKSWRCPCCKYEIDICDGHIISESLVDVHKSKAQKQAATILSLVQTLPAEKDQLQSHRPQLALV